MRVITPANSMGAQTPSATGGVAGTGSSTFQTRLMTAGGVPPSAPATGPSGAEILQHAAKEMRALLRLQYELSMSRNSLVSNLMKARHETAKNSISNIR